MAVNIGQSTILNSVLVIIVLLTAVSCATRPMGVSDDLLNAVDPTLLDDVVELGAQQQKATNSLAIAKKNLDNAREELKFAEQRLNVAEMLTAWKELAKERADVAEQVAQAKVSLIDAQLEEAKAQAVIDNDPMMSGQIDLSQYKTVVSERQQKVAELQKKEAKLQGQVQQSEKKYKEASQRLRQ